MSPADTARPSPDASVAVVIASYNAAATIGRAIRSALAQPETAEIIVIDDASTDNTSSAAASADDNSGRLKILVQPQNAGPSAARNRAIAASRAPWIAVLDADDFYLPARFAPLLAFAARADLIADDAVQVAAGAIDGPRRSLLGGDFGPARQVSFAEFVNGNITDPRRGRGELGFLKPIMRRKFLAAHDLAYREQLRLGEDYELYARALAHNARLVIVPAPGYVSVVRPDSLSGRHTESDLLHLRDCDLALHAITDLKAEDHAALRRHYLSVDCRLQWRLLINAVKERNARAALATFMRPMPVPLYLLTQLKNEFFARLARKLNRQPA
jgi:succinoglycan biosynthesis protein ExoU